MRKLMKIAVFTFYFPFFNIFIITAAFLFFTNKYLYDSITTKLKEGSYEGVYILMDYMDEKMPYFYVNKTHISAIIWLMIISIYTFKT